MFTDEVRSSEDDVKEDDDDDNVEVGDNLVAVKKYDEAEPIRTPEPELVINDDVFAEIVSSSSCRRFQPGAISVIVNS